MNDDADPIGASRERQAGNDQKKRDAGRRSIAAGVATGLRRPVRPRLQRAQRRMIKQASQHAKPSPLKEKQTRLRGGAGAVTRRRASQHFKGHG